MKETEDDFSPWLLRTEPSVRRWSIEIRDIVSGNREDSIAHFGSAPGYVKSLLFNSPEASTAEYCFDESLRRLIETWHPIANPDTERDLQILQLLGAFTPSEGLGKVLALLKSLNSLDKVGYDSRVQRLKPISLQVLEQYFPTEQAPLGAFTEYVAQLESNLTHPGYAVYSVARLRELRKLQASDSRLGAVIMNSPQLLHDLLAVFTPGLRSEKRDIRFLSAVYRHCLHSADVTVKPLTEFERVIRDLGLIFMKDNDGPYVGSADGAWRTAIRLNDDDFGLYYAKVHLPLGQESIDEKFDEVSELSRAEETPVAYELVLEEVATS